MEKKINLEEIISKEFDSSPGDMSKNWAKIIAKQAMLEFGKQLLELAAENAESYIHNYEANFENPEGLESAVNKQSILDTINQVE